MEAVILTAGWVFAAAAVLWAGVLTAATVWWIRNMRQR